MVKLGLSYLEYCTAQSKEGSDTEETKHRKMKKASKCFLINILRLSLRGGRVRTADGLHAMLSLNNLKEYKASDSIIDYQSIMHL